jgi:hypothetical protein
MSTTRGNITGKTLILIEKANIYLILLEGDIFESNLKNFPFNHRKSIDSMMIHLQTCIAFEWLCNIRMTFLREMSNSITNVQVDMCFFWHERSLWTFSIVTLVMTKHVKLVELVLITGLFRSTNSFWHSLSIVAARIQPSLFKIAIDIRWVFIMVSLERLADCQVRHLSYFES